MAHPSTAGSAAPGGETEEFASYIGWRRTGDLRPRRIVRAEGTRFWDDEGRSYLDLSSQLVATNLGHAPPAVAAAIAEQARTLAYVAPSFLTPVRERVESLLREVLPPGLTRFFFSTSGTEANEAALKLARLATGRPFVVSRPRSYHGSTAASIAVTGDYRRRAAGAASTLPGTLWAPDCYCYRCPLNLSYPGCGVACAEAVAETIDRVGDVAAVIVEPIVGTNGVLVPVPEYLPRLRAITRDRGVLLVADEVMTGWGRTGAWFAVDHWKVVPDLLTTAKGITSGQVPLGLTATTDAVFERFRGRPLPHGHTYEAHPVALAAAEAAITEYRRRGLIDRAAHEGEFLVRRLREIGARHPSVGDVRGRGLFAAVELVRDRSTKAPLNTPEEKAAGQPLVLDRVVQALLDEGVYAFGWVSHLLLAPPLPIERAELEEGLAALDRALTVADRALGRSGGG